MSHDTYVAVLAAMKREVAPFLEIMQGVRRKRQRGCMIWEGSYSGVQVHVITAGIASEHPTELLQGCAAIISTGFCGALHEDLGTGDVVLSYSVAHADRELINRILNSAAVSGMYDGSGIFDISVDEKLAMILTDVVSKEHSRLHTGRTVSCDRVIRNNREKQKVGSYFDALAVDMEDFGRIAVARQLRVPVLCCRAILDNIEDSVPGPWSGTGPRKLSKLLAKIPPAQQGIRSALSALVPVFCA
jgi:nucleoside phosphorylase